MVNGGNCWSSQETSYPVFRKFVVKTDDCEANGTISLVVAMVTFVVLSTVPVEKIADCNGVMSQVISIIVVPAINTDQWLLSVSYNTTNIRL